MPTRPRPRVVLIAAATTATSLLGLVSTPTARADTAPEPDPGAGTSNDLTVDPAVQAELEAGNDPAANVVGGKSLTPMPDEAAMLDAITEAPASVPSGGPVLLHGTVTSSGGGSGGGFLQVFLDDDAIPSGTNVALTPIAEVSVPSSGTFTVAPQMTRTITDALDGGYLNVLVSGTFQGRSFATVATRSYHLDTNTWTAIGSTTNPDLSLQATGMVDTEPTGRSLPVGGCVDNVVSTFSALAVVGEVHNSSLFNGSFTYGSQADSTLGVLVKPEGGNWKAEGTRSVTQGTGASAMVPLNPDEHLYLEGRFQYRNRHHLCSRLGTVTRTDYIEPMAWTGGLKRSYSITPKYCGGSDWSFKTETEPGGIFVRDRNRATTWSGALSIYGIGLSARSGFSTRVTQTWKTGKYASWVCGNGNYPSLSGRVFTSNTKR